MNLKGKNIQNIQLPSVNILSASTLIKGEIDINGDFRFDGKLYGNITCSGKLTIGSTGYIEGKIECKNAEISGQFIGEIKVKELLILKESSVIKGQIITGKLTVENGAKLTVNCDTDIVDLK